MRYYIFLLLFASNLYGQVPRFGQARLGGGCCPACGSCGSSEGGVTTRWDLAQMRRLVEIDRRETARQLLPFKDFTDDERASGRLKLSEQLVKNGRLDAGVRWKREIIKDFPT